MKSNAWHSFGCDLRQWLVTLAFSLALIDAARAANNTWSGGGADASWATGANWVGGVAPGSTSNLFFGGSSRLNNTNNIAASTRFNGIVFNSGADAFILNGNAIQLGGPVTNNSASSQTINLPMAMQQNTVISAFAGSLVLGDTLSGAYAVTKEGTNTLTFVGTNTYTGATTVNAGAVTFGSSSSNTIGAVTVAGGAAGAAANFNGPTSLGAGTLLVGNTANSRSVVNIANDLRPAQIKAGVSDNVNSAGAVYHNSGTVTASVAPLSLGEGIGAYGYYRLASGVLQTAINGDVNLATKGHGVLEITGGMMVLSNAFFLSKGGAVGVAGTLNVFGGVLNGSAVSDNYFTMGGTAANSFGQLNVGGSGVLNVSGGPAKNRTLSLMYADNNTNVVNLLTGGTIVANKVAANVTTGQSIFNFNGGTLTTTNTSIVGSTFMQGLTAAYIYPAGAFIDTTNLSLTVAQALLAPTDYGVTRLTLTSTGSGYIGAPAVVILGGSGRGATAIAQHDFSPSSPTYGQVTNLVVTCPGSGYQAGDTLTVSLRGGGSLTPASASATLGANDGSGGLTKLGTATLTLAGASTYGGLTTVSAGALVIQNDSALGTPAAGTLVSGGTALHLQGNITAAEPLTLNGTGLSDGGALRNVSGTNILTGPIALASAVRINSDSNTLTLSSATAITDAQNLTFGGTGNITALTALQTGAGTVTKDGNGTLTLSGANTYLGKTAIQNGVLSAGSLNSVAGGAASSGLGAPTTVADGTIDLGAAAATGQLTYTGSGETSDRVLNLAGTTGGGTVDQSGSSLLKFTSDLTVTGSGNKTLTLQGSTVGSGEIAGKVVDGASPTALAKAGTGTWTLTAANPFTGATAVNGGTLALSGANGAIASPAALTLAGNGTLSLNNTAAANNTDRVNDSASITMNGGTLSFSNDGSDADFSETAGPLTINQLANTVASSQAAGGRTSALTFASLSRTAGASVNFSGTGLGSDARNAIFFTAAPTLGTWATINGTGWATYDAVKGVTALDAGSYTDIAARGATIADAPASAVRIASAGTSGNIALGANPTAVSSLLQNTTTAATVDTAAKTFRSDGVMIASGQAALTLGTAANSGTLTATSAGGDLTLINHASSDLTVNAVIADNASPSALIKDGAGRAILTGTNTYSGATWVNAGSLNIQSSNALGSVINGTTVADGATLQLQGGVTTLAEPLTLSGVGVGSAGAMRNISGNNTYAGQVTLSGPTRIQSDTAGQTLTLANTNVLTGSGFGLTVGGVGNTAISNIIATGTGSVTKEGTGMLTLAGANTFSGTLAVKEGVLYTPTIQNVSANGTVGNSPFPVVLGSAGKSGTIRYPGGSGTSSKPFTMETGGTGIVDVVSSGTTLTLSGLIDGYGTLTKVGAGALTPSAANTFSGPLAVQEGKISTATINNAGTAGVLGKGTDPVTLGAIGKTGTLSYTGTTTASNRKFTLAAGGFGTFDVTTAGNALMLSDTIDGAGSLVKSGAATLSLSGANTYSGTTTVSAAGGTLHFTRPAALYNGNTANWTAANLVVNSGGTLGLSVGSADDFTAANIDTLKALGTAAGGFKTGALLGLDTSDGNFTYDSAIANPNAGANALGLVKLGTNSLTLTAAQAYTGTTVVKNGTLALSNTVGQALQGPLTIGDGTTASAYVALGANDQLNPAALLTFTGVNSKFAFLNLQGKRQTAASVAETTAGFGVIQTRDTVGTYSNSTFTFNVASGSQSFQGYFRDTGSGTDAANALALVKLGAGTLRFGKGGALGTGSASASVPAHYYSGGTVISNGTVALTSTNALPSSGSGNIVLDGGSAFAGTLDLNGFSHIVTGLSGLPGAVLGRVVNNAPNSNATVIVGNNNAMTAFAGSILDNTGTGSTLALVKAGTGSQTLSGTNTYSAGTIVSNGTLIAVLPASLPGYDAAGKVTLNAATTLGLATGDGTNGWNSAQINALHTNANPAANTTVLAIDATLAPASDVRDIRKNYALTKLGTNSLTLNGLNAYTGLTTVNAGTLNFGSFSTNAIGAATVNGGALDFNSFSTNAMGAVTVNGGSLTFGAGSSNGLSGVISVKGGVTGATMTVNGLLNLTTNAAQMITVGSTSGDRSSAVIASDVVVGKVYAGNGLGSSGAVVQNGGTLNVGPSISGTEVLTVGNSGGYGYYRMNGGTINVGQLAFTGSGTGASTVGLFDMVDGTISVVGPSGNWLIWGWKNGTSMLNMFGGTINSPNGNNTTMAFLAGGNATCVLNMLGSNAVLNTTVNGKQFDMANQAGNAGSYVSLNAGTLIANRLFRTQASTPTFVNFNGGTLRANTAQTQFLEGHAFATVYPGGAIIDASNVAITVNQSLLAPTSSGVSSLTLQSGGAGYIGAPVVALTGGSGTGATAIASVDLNTASPTFGQVTGFQVTSPGFGYLPGDALNVALSGGGFTAPASATCSLAPNALTGGLTKLGVGTLVLGNTNTYAGVTTISNGTLRLGRADALPANAAVTVAGGLYDLNGFAVTNGAVTVTGGAISNGVLNGRSFTVSDSAVIRALLTSSGGVTKNGSGSLVLNSSGNGFSGPITVNEGTLTLVQTPPLSGLSYWLDAADGSKLSLSGSNVTAWADSGALGVNFTQATAAQQPVYVTNAINGLPAVRFNGITNKLTSVKTATCQTVFIVNTARGYVDFDGIWGKDSTLNIRLASATNWYYPGNNNDFAYGGGQMYINGISNSSFTANTPHLLSVISATPRASITTALGFFTTTGPNRWFKGDVGEVLVYNSALSTNDRQVVEAYLMSKWLGVANSLLSTNATLAVAAGATANLNGQSQTFADVSGSGLVSNGTLTVTGTLAPGGTNVIGTLTVGPLASQNATLLVDVALDGTCDRLVVQGDLNLSTLKLQVANPNQLKRGGDYTIASCTGTLSGSFSETNLTGGWHIRLDPITHTVHLVSPEGTLIRLR